MTAQQLDFQQLKESISIEKTAEILGLQLKPSGQQLRGPCPFCATGGDRILVITPARSLFYCFSSKVGGDQISLVAHIKDMTPRRAAEFLSEHVAPVRTAPLQLPQPQGFKPLDYLEHDHPAVEAVGFDAEVAKGLGVGFAGKGILNGLVAVPVRLPDGTLSGYIGITEAKLPSKWHGLPETNVVKLKTA